MAFTLAWNVSAQKKFQSGVDRAVLYVRDNTGAYPLGVAWEGFKGITEKPEGAEVTDLYANNTKYAAMVAAEKFSGTIEAYHFPDAFYECLGTVEAATTGMYFQQQPRSTFALSYRNYVGSDAGGATAGYQIHVVYGCLVTPSETPRQTINDKPEAISFSWDFTTTPVSWDGGYDGGQDVSPVSHLIFNSWEGNPTNFAALETYLYGQVSPAIVPHLLMPQDLYDIIAGLV